MAGGFPVAAAASATAVNLSMVHRTLDLELQSLFREVSTGLGEGRRGPEDQATEPPLQAVAVETTALELQGLPSGLCIPRELASGNGRMEPVENPLGIGENPCLPLRNHEGQRLLSYRLWLRKAIPAPWAVAFSVPC